MLNFFISFLLGTYQLNITPPSDPPADPPAAPPADPPADPPENWLASLPEDIRDNPSLAKFSDPATLAKSYINAQQMIGRDKIPMPQSDDDWQETFNRLGRPEDAAGYDFTAAQLPEGVEVPEATQLAIRGALHQSGLNNAQAESVYNFITGQMAESAEGIQAEEKEFRDATEAKLKEQWGDTYPEKLAIAKRAVEVLGDDDILQYMEDSGLGDDPILIKFFAEIGDKLLEDTQLDGLGGSDARTPDDIKAEIGELQGKSAYMDNKDPEHKALVKKVSKLYEILHAA